MICRHCRLRALPTSIRNVRLTRKSSPLSQCASMSTSVESASSEKESSPSSTLLAAFDQAERSNKSAKLSASSSQPSSVPAGVPLKGLNYLKSGSDPIAMEDSEYPEWLWSILDSNNRASDTDKENKASTKKQRKARRGDDPDRHASGPNIPLHEQTTDLPSGDGTIQGALLAAEARNKLTRSMREKRRAKIKETNFLKAMG